MNDKNVLIALNSLSEGEGVLRFITVYLSGRNLRLTLCILHEKNENADANESLLLTFTTICQHRNIPLTIRHFSKGVLKNLEKQATYSDLLIMEKSTLLPLAVRDEFGVHGCSIIVVPAYFKVISNVLLIHNGTQASLKSVKEFFQFFSRQIVDLTLTLLMVTPVKSADIEAPDEIMLVEYLKQYSKNVGILKVREPLTDKLLKPIPYNQSTLVVGSLQYLLSLYGENSRFKPLFDEKATLFLPAYSL